MAKFLSDIVDYLFKQQQVGFSAIDTTALDELILEFIETPDNGYITEIESQWDDDATAYINVCTLVTTTYFVTGTDANGCVMPGSFVVTEPALLTSSYTLSNYSGYNVV